MSGNVITPNDCRILLFAPSTQLATSFIQRVTHLQEQQPLDPHASPDVNPPPIDFSEGGSGGGNADDGDGVTVKVVPWTLRNKYYAAPLHFAIASLSSGGWRAEDVQGAPAIIYVWSDGSPHRPQLTRLAADLARAKADPEISLAVRLPRSDASSEGEAPDGDGDDDDDDDDLDSFAASCGFEYVDARHERERDSNSDIPTLPRTLDALSTILWPSLVQHPSSRAHRRISARPSAATDALLHNADEDEAAHALAALLRGAQDDEGVRGLRELERWLDESASEDDDGLGGGGSAWGDDDDEDERRDARTPAPRKEGEKSGFDDDFAAFVSAPANRTPSTATVTTPTGAEPKDWPSGEPLRSPDSTHAFTPTFNFDLSSAHEDDSDDEDDGLSPVHRRRPGAGVGLYADASYATLGSVSDFGSVHGDGDMSDAARTAKTEAEDDGGLPSQAEIAATSARIFGPGSVGGAGAAGDADERAAGGRAFDLTSVLGVLEGMKAEIAAMPDGEEKRRAAARVALGLAAGLGVD